MSRIITIIASLFIMNLFSCSPLRHYEAVATDTDVSSKEKALLEGPCTMNFPPRITKGDTVETVKFDTLYLQSGDTVFYSTPSDSKVVEIDHVKTVYKDRIITKTITRTITDTVESTSTVDAIRRQLNVCSENERKKTDQLSTAKSAKNKWFWLFIAACGIIAGGIISKVKGWV